MTSLLLLGVLAWMETDGTTGERQTGKDDTSVASTSQVPPKGPRHPLPADDAIESGLAAAREIFQEEYRQAKDAAAKQALARKILQKGLGMQNDRVGRFVLLRLARDIATQARDAKLAFECVERLAQSFEINPAMMKAQIINSLLRSARTSNDRRAVIPWALNLSQAAADEDSPEVAEQIARLAVAEAGKLRDRELLQQARARLKEAEDLGRSQAALEAARQVLKDRPDDPEANLVVGRYLCLRRGDWDIGLPLLAKGNDAALKALAEQELRSPPQDAAAQVKLADGWWEIAQNTQGHAKKLALARAGSWYQKVDLEDAPGLIKVKVEKRLQEVPKLQWLSVSAHRQPPPLAVSPFDGETAKEHQRRWAEYLGVPVEMTNSIGMKFVLIPPGEFMMGASEQDILRTIQDAAEANRRDGWPLEKIRDEGPQHRARITRAYYLGCHEVTQSQYQLMMNANPSTCSPQGKFKDRVKDEDTSQLPVDNVSWSDAAIFCERLALRSAEQIGSRSYRLPTEAEWEYACRAGTTTRWCFGDTANALDEYGWCQGLGGYRTRPVGQKKANAWGLYDVHGNVWEWCSDWYSNYGPMDVVDPCGPPSGNRGHVVRSGCQFAFRYETRCSQRHCARDPDGMGFRVVAVLNRKR